MNKMLQTAGDRILLCAVSRASSSFQPEDAGIPRSSVKLRSVDVNSDDDERAVILEAMRMLNILSTNVRN